VSTTATVNREELLGRLEAVVPGLSPREIIEQSNCFVFLDGEVLTYNDEVACRAPSPLPASFTGAVRADKCLDILRKFPEEDLEVRRRGGDLLFSGKRRWTGLRLEAEVLLPVTAVERPKKWRPLPAEFGDAVGVVARCASRDQSRFSSTCVHLHPEWLEATDDVQVCRWPLVTGLTKSTLVRHTSLQHVATAGATEFALTPQWLHFRTTGGLILSCRRYRDEYPDIAPVLKVRKASPVQFPKSLAEECEKADVFSSENVEQNLVRVEMAPGALRVRADGVSGWFLASRKFRYNGPQRVFYCPPQLLIDLVMRHNECLVAADRLWVKGDRYTYFTCLSKPEENGAVESPAAAEESENE